MTSVVPLTLAIYTGFSRLGISFGRPDLRNTILGFLSGANDGAGQDSGLTCKSRSFASLRATTRTERIKAGLRMSVQLSGSASLQHAGVGKQEIPRGIEIEPALAAEPTGRQRGDVEEGVAAHADHLGAVPAEESAGGKAHLRGMGDAAQAD